MPRASKKAAKKAGKARQPAKETRGTFGPDSDKRSVIITFKPKEQRPDSQADKIEIVDSLVGSKVTFFDAGMMAATIGGPPAGTDPTSIGFDVNLYEAPIVVAFLTDDEIKKLERDGNIAQVEEDGECYALHDFGYPFYSGYPPVAGVNELIVEGQPSVLAETIPAGLSQIKAPLAWDSSRGKGINVAVLDTGIDFTHPDLAPNFRGGVSFVPGQTLMDGNGHGTHCAGTVAAAINGVGVVGVAPAASLFGVKVLSNSGSGNWSWLIAGIDWCINNRMRVLSMSLGGSAAPTALETMCNAAWNRGLLLVAAAGNSGPGMGTVGFPAKYRSVVAVSAIDNSNVIAGFSSRGPEVELSAPGVNVLSTLPGNRYGPMNGTSMACPHVSGAAVLAWGGHRYANNVTIRRLLAWSSDNLGVPGRDPLFGYGRVDANQAAGELTPPPAIPGIP